MKNERMSDSAAMEAFSCEADCVCAEASRVTPRARTSDSAITVQIEMLAVGHVACDGEMLTSASFPPDHAYPCGARSGRRESVSVIGKLRGEPDGAFERD